MLNDNRTTVAAPCIFSGGISSSASGAQRHPGMTARTRQQNLVPAELIAEFRDL
jgi:hypothetical protein